MTYEEFREELEAWWSEIDARALSLKNSQGALSELMDKYEGFGPDQRVLADQVFTEWIGSENDRKRFDALAMIDQFCIRSAADRLRRAEAEVAARSNHEAPYELAKLRRILRRVTGGGSRN